MRIKAIISKVLIFVIILMTVTSCSKPEQKVVETKTDKKPFTVEFNEDNPLAKAYDSEVAKGLYIDSTIRKLPNIFFGTDVNPLRIAMALDKTGKLKDLVVEFSKEQNIAKRNELSEKILLKWMGCDDLIIKGEGYKVDPRKIIAIGRYIDNKDRMMKSIYMSNPKQIATFNKLYKLSVDELHSVLISKIHYKDFCVDFKEMKMRRKENEDFFYYELKSLVNKELKAHPDRKADVLSDLNRVLMYIYDDDTKGYYKVLTYLFSKYPEYVNAFFKDHNATNEYTDGDDVIIGSYQVIKAGDGNDTIKSSKNGSVIYPGKGNDKIYGSKSDDIYIINKGDGVNTIYEMPKSKDNDYIIFGVGITRKDIVIEKINDNDIVLKVKGSNDIVVIKNQANESVKHSLISNIYFSNGFVYEIDKNEKDEFKLVLKGLAIDEVSGNEKYKPKLTEEEKSKKFKEIFNQIDGRLFYKGWFFSFNREYKLNYIDYDSFFLKDGEAQPTDQRHSDITSDGIVKWNIEGEKAYGNSAKFEKLDKKITLNGKEINLPISFSDLDEKYSDFDLLDIKKISRDMCPFVIESKKYGTKLYGLSIKDYKRYQMMRLADKDNIIIGSFQVNKDTSKIEGIFLPEGLPKLDVRINGIGVGSTANEMYEKFGAPFIYMGKANWAFYYIDDGDAEYIIIFMFDKEAYDYRKKAKSKVKKNTITHVIIQKK